MFAIGGRVLELGRAAIKAFVPDTALALGFSDSSVLRKEPNQ